MRKDGLQPSSMSLWCLNASSSRLHELVERSLSTPTDPELLCILEELSEAALALSMAAGHESHYSKPLLVYKLHVDQLLMFLHLGSPNAVHLPHLILKLNQKFPPHSKDPEIQLFRNGYAKLLGSTSEAERYLADVWLPNRGKTFEVLFNNVRAVAQLLPYTFLDQVGTRHHELAARAIQKIQTDLGRNLLSVLTNAKESLTEADLLRVFDTTEPG